ncbi:MAG TPA: TolC family protein, partial [bacterium]|nr:TolC family protein [bacterium]
MIRIDVRCFPVVGIWLLSFCLVFSYAAHAQEALTLKDSIKIALENHSAISQAKASLLAAESQSRSSATAFFPTASLGGYYTRLDHDRYQTTSIDLGTGTQTMVSPYMRKYQYSMGLQVAQPLFTGGAIYYSRKLSKTGVGIAKEQLEGTEQDVELGVAETYYAVLQAQHLLGVAKLTEESMEAHR